MATFYRDNSSVFQKLWVMLILLGCVGALQAEEKPTLDFFNGTEKHSLRALKDRVPPFVHLNDLLKSLGFSPATAQGNQLRMELNQRPVLLNPQEQSAYHSGITQPLGIRIISGEVYLQTTQMIRLFSQLLGRQMVYEPVSKSLHIPAADIFSAKVISRRLDQQLQLEIIYSKATRPPKVERFNQQLIVKIYESPIRLDKTPFTPNAALQKMEVFEQLPDGSTEILFLLGQDVANLDIEPFNKRNPRTIVNFSGAFSGLAPDGATTKAEAPVGLRRIVIDPGHGGKDRGSIGPTGLREKEVTLDLSRKLKRILEREQGYEVRLTREGDSFLSLKARTGVANNFKADLFISIHVNGVPVINARGSETFYLSLDDNSNFDASHYTDHEDETTGDEEEVDDLELILWDMAQAKHLDDSFRFAKYIQDELNTLAGTRSRGVKQAPMKVLKGAQMPAVLVEVAFITDAVEESKLKGSEFREKIVRSIVNAIATYDREVQLRSKGSMATQEEGH